MKEGANKITDFADSIFHVFEVIFLSIIWMITFVFELMYMFLDLFPDVIKWIVLVAIILMGILFILHGSGIQKTISSFILFFLWRAYSIQENITLNEAIPGLKTIPIDIYEYFYNNPWYLIIGIVFILIVVRLLNTEDIISENKKEYYSDNFSPSEEREYHRNEKIRSIKRELKR
jgi:hypothetical protein